MSTLPDPAGKANPLATRRGAGGEGL